MLKSVESPDEAAFVIDGTRQILGQSGFNLTKFVVNDLDLHQIPDDLRASEVKDLNLDSYSKVLGVKWRVHEDEFYFDVKVAPEQKVTIYDPTGFINPFIIAGKVLFQEAFKLGSWDDHVTAELACR